MPVELDRQLSERADQLLVRIHVAVNMRRTLSGGERADHAHDLLGLLSSVLAPERELLSAPIDWRPTAVQVSRAIGSLSVRLREITLPPDA